MTSFELNDLDKLWDEYETARKLHPGLSVEDFIRRRGGTNAEVAAFLGVVDDLQELPKFEAKSAEYFGAHKIVRTIGSGGMGIVYECQREDGSPYALKAIDPTCMLLQGSTRFHRECRIASSLDHPHIVPIFDFNVRNAQPYLTMKLIDGPNLSEIACHDLSDDSLLLSRHQAIARSIAKRLAGNWRAQAQIGIDCADALAHAHHRGVLHRDVKPANILIDAELKSWVSDFGLAKRHCEGHDATLTRSSNLLGSPRYMAPEQIRGEADERSDVFGLGLVLYEMAIMRSDGKNTRRDIWKGGLSQVSKWNPRVPVQFEMIIRKAVTSEAEERFQSATELKDALQDFLQNQALLTQQGWKNQVRKQWSQLRGGATERKNSANIVRRSYLPTALMLIAVAGLSAAASRVDVRKLVRPFKNVELVNDSQFYATSNQILINPESPMTQRTSYHSRGPAISPDGSARVAYTSKHQDGDGYGVFTRAVDQEGNLSAEVAGNQGVKGDQKHSSVTYLPDGNYVVTWDSRVDLSERGYDVYCRKFAPDGRPLTDDIRVNEVTDAYQIYPNTVIDQQGQVTIAWRSRYQDGDGYGVIVRRFDSDLAPLSSEVVVSTETKGDQKNPMLAVDSQGNVMITWHTRSCESQHWEVRARSLSLDGRLGREYQVTQLNEEIFSSFNGRVAADLHDNFHLVWRQLDHQGHSSIHYRQIRDGEMTPATKASAETHSKAQRCSVAVVGSQAIVVWEAAPSSDGGKDVFGQIMDRDGSQIGNCFHISQETLGDQYQPWVTSDGQDNCVVFWSGRGTVDENGVYARWFQVRPQESSASKSRLAAADRAQTLESREVNDL